MATLAVEVFWSVALPALAYAAGLFAVARGLIRGRFMPALLIAGLFAAGQAYIVGDAPFPPLETAHAVVYLGFVQLLHTRRDGFEWATLAALQVGLYFVLSPLVASAPGAVFAQATVANAVVIAALRSGLTHPAFIAAAAVATGTLGIIILSSGSTSLALTAGLTAALTLTALAFRTHVPLRLGWWAVALPTLLALEAYNYV